MDVDVIHLDESYKKSSAGSEKDSISAMHSAMSFILLASAAVGAVVTPVWLAGIDAGAPSHKRAPSDYRLIFNGTGTGIRDRDASIEGTAFLTYAVVPNSTYNVDACLQFCDSLQSCVFVNLFYEFNNMLLDFAFCEQSNLKCAAYADVHTAAEKTNFGGQQSYPYPGPLTYIQQSTGYARIARAGQGNGCPLGKRQSDGSP